MSRGDHREPIFKTTNDRSMFLDTLADACRKTGWLVHAYCLMSNHFHLVVETPTANLVDGMKWLLGTYTIRFNRRHDLVGHLFAGRYKAIIVDSASPGYFRTVCNYVHLNPARAHLIQRSQELSMHPWSSYPEYLKAPAKRREWLCVERLLGEFGLKDDARGRRALARLSEHARGKKDDEAWKDLRRGWFFGSDEVKKDLLQRRSTRIGKNHMCCEHRECAVDKAQRIIHEELVRQGFSNADLALWKKGHPVKCAIARCLRAETTVTLAWIAQHLAMGSWTYVAKLVSVNTKD